MVRRQAILGLAALIASTGCNAGPSGGLKRQDPPVARETISKDRIIAQHNKNAATIQSLKASPSIVVDGDGQSVRLSGQIAMERPKDFRLDMRFHGNPKADIGSNDQGFWFWVKDNKDKAIYVCDYENVNANPLGVSMQPEWIMEAMGLRSIPDREAATISATKGDKPGQLVLTQLRNDPKGGSLTKVTIVDEVTGEILEHRLYSGAREKLLARATIAQTQQIRMEPTEADPGGSTVNFPAKMQLEWVVEKFKLEITMGVPKINPQFPKEQRAALFTEPQINGAVRVDLAKRGGAPASASSWMYESAPRPVRLGKPEADAEPAGFDGVSRSPRVRSPLTADLPPLPSTGYIGPQVPRAPEPDGVQAAASPGWGGATFNR